MNKEITFAGLATNRTSIEYYASSTSWMVRCAVAKNSFTPADILDKLAHDPKWEVQAYVVENPNTDISTFEYLLKMKNPDTLWYIVRSESVPEQIVFDAVEILADKAGSIIDAVKNGMVPLGIAKRYLSAKTLLGVM